MIFKVERKPKFSIKCFDCNLIEVTHHYLIEFNDFTNEPNVDFLQSQVSIENIDETNFNLLENPVYKLKDLSAILKRNKRYSIGILINVDGNVAGMIWGLLRGGKDNQYKVINSDFYLHHLYIFPEYRGKGLGGYMINAIYKEACMMGHEIKTVSGAVRTNNEPAIRSYKKVGCIMERKKTFVTVGKINIPSPKI